MLAGAGSSGHSQIGFSLGAVADAGDRPGREDQDHGVIQGPVPRVGFTVWMVLGAAVFGAGLAELAEGDAVAVRLGQEVAAEAQHVRPLAQLLAAGARTAEPPRDDDHLSVVLRAG